MSGSFDEVGDSAADSSRDVDEFGKSSKSTKTETSGLTREVNGLGVEFTKTRGTITKTDDDTKGFHKSVMNLNSDIRLLGHAIKLVKFPALATAAALATKGIGALAGGAVGLTSSLGLATAGIGAMVLALGQATPAVAALGAAYGAMGQAMIAIKLSGVTKAFAVLSDNATTAQNAMKLLKGPAKEFGEELLKMKPKFDAIRAAAGEGLFPGIIEGFKAATQNLGPLKDVIQATGGSVGYLAAQFGKLLGSKGFGQEFRQFGLENARVIRVMGGALIDLFAGFVKLLNAGRPFIEWLSNSIAKWAEAKRQMLSTKGAQDDLTDSFDRAKRIIQPVVDVAGSLYDILKTLSRAAFPTGLMLWQDFADWMDRIAAQTRKADLKNFFADAGRELQIWARIIGNTFAALMNIFGDATDLGHSLALSLDEGARKFRDWTESVKGENQIKKYFEEIEPTIKEIGRLVRDVVIAFVDLSRDPHGQFLEVIQRIRKELLPLVVDLLKTSAERLTGPMLDLLIQAGKVWLNLAGASGPLVLLLKTISQALKGVNTLLSNEIIRSAAVWALVFAGVLKITKGISGVMTAMVIKSQLIGTNMKMIPTQFASGRAGAGTIAASDLSGAAGGAAGAQAAKAGQAMRALKQAQIEAAFAADALATALGTSVAGALAIVAATGAVVVGMVFDIKDNFLGLRDALGAFFNWIGRAVTDFVDTISMGHSDAIFNALSVAVHAAGTAFKFLGEHIGPILKLLLHVIGLIGIMIALPVAAFIATQVLLFKGFTAVLKLVIGAVKVIINVIKTLVGVGKDVGKAIGRYLVRAFDDVKDAVRDASRVVSNVAQQLWKWLKWPFEKLVNWVAPIAKRIFDWYTWPYRKAYDFIRPIVGKIVHVVKSVIGGAVGILKNIGGKILDAIKSPFTKGSGAVKGIVNDIVDWLKTAVSDMSEPFKDVADKIVGVFHDIRGPLTDAINWVISNIINRIPGVEIDTIGGSGADRRRPGTTGQHTGQGGHPGIHTGGRVLAGGKIGKFAGGGYVGMQGGGTIGGKVATTATDVIGGIKGAFGSLKGDAGGISDIMPKWLKGMGHFIINKLWDLAKGLPGKVWGGVKDVGGKVGDFVAGLPGAIFAGGGHVAGPGGIDNVPAMLTRNEFVVTPGGESILESLIGPGILKWLARVQPSAKRKRKKMATGGRVGADSAVGAVAAGTFSARRLQTETKTEAHKVADSMVSELAKGHVQAVKDADKFVNQHRTSISHLKKQTDLVTIALQGSTIKNFEGTRKGAVAAMGDLQKQTVAAAKSTQKGITAATAAISKSSVKDFEAVRKSGADAIEQLRKVTSESSKQMRSLIGSDMIGLRKDVDDATDHIRKAGGDNFAKFRKDATDSSSGLKKGVTDDLDKTSKDVLDSTSKTKKDGTNDFDNLRKDVLDATSKTKKGATDDFDKAQRDVLDSTSKTRKGGSSDFKDLRQSATNDASDTKKSVSKDFDNLKQDVTKSTGGTKKTGSKDFDDLRGAVVEGISKIGKAVNNALEALGVKKVDFKVGEAKGGGDGKGKQLGGLIEAQIGGLIEAQSGKFVTGSGTGDSVPAMLEPGEYVLNRKMVSRIGVGNLDKRNFGDMARFQIGGLVRHMAEGGAITDKVDVPKGGFPDAMGALPGLDALAYIVGKAFGLHVISGLRPGAITTSGNISDHSWGGAVDMSNGFLTPEMREASMALAKAAGFSFSPGDAIGTGGPIKQLIYGTPLYGGHEDHMHVALQEMWANSAEKVAQWLAGLSGGIGVEQIARMMLEGPKGPMTDMGQAALDKVWKESNAYVASKAPMGVPGAPGEAIKNLPASLQMYNKQYPANSGATMPANKIAELAEWAGQGRVPGVTMQQVTVGESGGRPGAVSPDGGYGLWQITTPYGTGPIHQAGFSGYDEMLNPVSNAIVMDLMYPTGWSGGSPWYGTGGVSNYNAHYTGPMKQLGGLVQMLQAGGQVEDMTGFLSNLKDPDADPLTTFNAFRDYLNQTQHLDTHDLTKLGSLSGFESMWSGLAEQAATADVLKASQWEGATQGDPPYDPTYLRPPWLDAKGRFMHAQFAGLTEFGWDTKRLDNMFKFRNADAKMMMEQGAMSGNLKDWALEGWGGAEYFRDQAKAIKELINKIEQAIKDEIEDLQKKIKDVREWYGDHAFHLEKGTSDSVYHDLERWGLSANPDTRMITMPKDPDWETIDKHRGAIELEMHRNMGKDQDIGANEWMQRSKDWSKWSGKIDDLHVRQGLLTAPFGSPEARKGHDDEIMEARRLGRRTRFSLGLLTGNEDWGLEKPNPWDTGLYSSSGAADIISTILAAKGKIDSTTVSQGAWGGSDFSDALEQVQGSGFPTSQWSAKPGARQVGPGDYLSLMNEVKDLYGIYARPADIPRPKLAWLKALEEIADVDEKWIPTIDEQIDLMNEASIDPNSPGGEAQTKEEISALISKNRGLLGLLTGQEGREEWMLGVLSAAAAQPPLNTWPGNAGRHAAWLSENVDFLTGDLLDIHGMTGEAGRIHEVEQIIKGLLEVDPYLDLPDLIERYNRASGVSPPWEDDLSWASQIVDWWSTELDKRIHDLAGPPKITEASNEMKRWQKIVDDINEKMNPGEPPDLGLSDLLQQQLYDTQRQLIVAQAQFPVFQSLVGAPSFGGGGIVHGYQHGGAVPIIAHDGEGVFTEEQMGAMGGGNGDVQVVLDGDLHTDGKDLKDAVEVYVDGKLQNVVSAARRTVGVARR